MKKYEVHVRLPSRPHDAGSHDQQMTPAVQRVVDSADKRAQERVTTVSPITTVPITVPCVLTDADLDATR